MANRPTVASRSGPVPHRSDIDVDETGIGIVAHTAGLEIERRPVQVTQIAPRKCDIYGHAPGVEALLRHSVASLPKLGVGRRRAVARNNVIGLARVQLVPQGMQKVQKLGVDRLDVAGAMIAQHAVDLAQALWNRPTLEPELGVDPFPGVQVVEG